MNCPVPIYVEERVVNGATQYHVRGLPVGEPHRTGDRLSRALARLTTDLRRQFAALAAKPSHEELMAAFLVPPLDEAWVTLRLEGPWGSAKVGVLLVAWEAFERRVVRVPALEDVYFEVGRGEDLVERATTALQRHFRDRVQRDESESERPAVVLSARRAWLTRVEVPVDVPVHFAEEERPRFAQLGGPATESGAVALERVGRCLNALYPEELDRAEEREREVDELAGLLTGGERRPVLVLGARSSGKTAVVHEALHRLLARREEGDGAARQWWQIAPARLVSGMSYLGQWEQRLMAILEEAKRRDHVLYFDDLPGLFLAGISAHSRLTVAHVLKPWIERRDIRLLCEVTPEGWRALRERDRGFADLFQILRVPALDEAATYRCLVAVQRRLEERQNCRLTLDVLPAVVDLVGRHDGEAEFPGKAAGFLRQVALKRQGQTIGRPEVIAEFHDRTGLSPIFLDRRRQWGSEEVFEALARRVVGQAAALRAAADIVGLARARLNDPGKPLGSLLFLGPSGVGKTECAKALAAFLFGDADRLVRFDMNEYVTPAAVARLTGTLGDPEGLLTGAVRRQPYAVVLFDEIEKADPRAHDLLLSVLGEGRLTDAYGRTAGFSGCLVVMTSNLGVREAGQRLGFVPDGTDAEAVFVDAARAFFRPEFFNRLDRVIPFRALDRDELARLADRHLAAVLNRHGLHQRRCVVRVEAGAMDRWIESGRDPRLGARALKRAVERDVAQPLARRLVETVAGDVVRIALRAGPTGLEVGAHPLRPAVRQDRPGGWRDAGPEEREADWESRIGRLEEWVDRLAPAGPVGMSGLGVEEARYFAAREQWRRVRAIFRRALAEGGHHGGAGARMQPLRRGHRRAARFKEAESDAGVSEETTPFQPSGGEGMPGGGSGMGLWEELAGEACLLDHLLRAAKEERVRVTFGIDGGGGVALPAGWLKAYHDCLSGLWGYRCEAVGGEEDLMNGRPCGVEFAGPGALGLAGSEAGLQSVEGPDGRLLILRVGVEEAPDAEKGTDGLGLAGGPGTDGGGWLLRAFRHPNRLVDHRSGWELIGPFTGWHLRQLLLRALPWPGERGGPPGAV
ncbi:MAG: ATP-dependent Clp protease ATP-binding subunit [Verrucomicrobiae bacterium]|nr:ATP-dependent Clp protease ATP-binding subunit [Verrucomicrobiae bacterium]